VDERSALRNALEFYIRQTNLVAEEELTLFSIASKLIVPLSNYTLFHVLFLTWVVLSATHWVPIKEYSFSPEHALGFGPNFTYHGIYTEENPHPFLGYLENTFLQPLFDDYKMKRRLVGATTSMSGWLSAIVCGMLLPSFLRNTNPV